MGFEYSPLDNSKPQTRLLTLLPGSEDSNEIYCKLSSIELGDSAGLQYEALSYVWGDETDPKEITVDDKLFVVRKNLYYALLHFRHTTEPRVLWTDAVCINQSDSEEVNRQILQMRLIYGGTARVIIWLGNGNESTDRAIDALNALESWLEHIFTQISGWGPVLSDMSEPERKQHVDAIVEFYDRCEALIPDLAVLFALPWWERAWVVQEAALPEKIPIAFCGKKQISFDLLKNLRYCFSRVPGVISRENREEYYDRVLEMRDLFKIDQSWDFASWAIPYRWTNRLDSLRLFDKWELLPDDNLENQEAKRRVGEFYFHGLLRATQNRKCTEPKDRIFSLLGMLPRHFTTDHFPDYNVPVAKVYQKATFLLLKTSGIDILNFSSPLYRDSFAMIEYGTSLYENKGSYRDDLPSWCVNFSFDWLSCSMKCAATTDQMASSGDVKPQCISVDETGDVLIVQGLHLGMVTFAQPRFLLEMIGWDGMDDEEFRTVFPWSLTDYFQTVLPFYEQVFKCLTKHLGLETACDEMASGAVRRIELIDTIQLRDPEYYDKIACVEEQRLLMEARMSEEIFKKFGVPPGIVSSAISSAVQRTYDDPHDLGGYEDPTPALVWDKLQHSYFSTSETGYYGKAVGIVKEGDVLALIVGCRRPAILRPQGTTFQLIGFAFVPFIMNGELVKDFGTDAQREFHLI